MTSDPYFRLFTTMVGINVVDSFRLSQFHNLLPLNRIKTYSKTKIDEDAYDTYSMKKYAGILSSQLLYFAHGLEGKVKKPMMMNSEEVVVEKVVPSKKKHSQTQAGPETGPGPEPEVRS